MKHACSWNFQICCPSVEMSSLGLRPCDDMSTSGQHIWMFHLQPCIICILLSSGTRQQSSPVSLTELHSGSGRLLRFIRKAKASWIETRAPISWIVSMTNYCFPCGCLVGSSHSEEEIVAAVETSIIVSKYYSCNSISAFSFQPMSFFKKISIRNNYAICWWRNTARSVLVVYVHLLVHVHLLLLACEWH